MTDLDIKQAMKALAVISGLKLSDERIEQDLPAYKTYLAAMEAIARTGWPIEAEPLPMVVLRPDRRSVP